MKKLKVIFLICILCSITGCSLLNCNIGIGSDCGYDEEMVPAFANKSEVTIKIVVIGKGHPRYEKLVANNDTLHNSHYKNTDEWYLTLNDYYRSSRVELYFLDEPQKCLIFDGPVEDDGIDIRSWESYKRGNNIENWADFWAGIEYVYTITPEHKAMAKEEDCDFTR